MKTNVRSIAGVLLAGAALASVAIVMGEGTPAGTVRRPELEYLEAVNRAAPPNDPQLLFLLMAQYANANRHGEGADFFAARLREFDPGLSDSQISGQVACVDREHEELVGIVDARRVEAVGDGAGEIVVVRDEQGVLQRVVDFDVGTEGEAFELGRDVVAVDSVRVEIRDERPVK
jgi:hypothetical protein